MDFFFNPRGIAVIGATPSKTKGGYAILKNLMTGFTGKIYPVNPRYKEIEGLTCYDSVRRVPDPADLAIVFIPAAMVPQAILECVEREIPGVIIESGGFAETGEEGLVLQESLKQIAEETGIRLWGPNCMGLVDTVRKHVFSFAAQSIWNENFVPGKVSLIVQSGMLSGVFLIDAMTHGTLDISKVCSIGNKADVDECDLLEYLINDPETYVVGLYLESVVKGRRFMQICRSSQKPVVLLRGGKSEKGAKAAMSHTASLAGNNAVISGAMAQAGVMEASDFRQMMDICRALSMFPPRHSDTPSPLWGEGRGEGCRGEGRGEGPKGRIAVLTYSGGAGIVSSDFIDASGLELSELSPETLAAMKTVFPDWMPVSNPVDLWPAVEMNGAKRAYETAVNAVCADPEVDAVFLHVFVGGFDLKPEIASVAKMAQDAGKPMFCFLLGDREETYEFQKQAQRLGIAVFRELNRSVECIKAVFEQKKLLERRKIAAAATPAGLVPEKWIEAMKGKKGSLDEHLSKRILSACKIPVVEEKIVASVEDAINTASNFRFPVVMKGLSPGKMHKTELGLVRLGISSDDAVKTNFESLKAAMPESGKILIQKQIQGELELIVGLIRDPQFGPCVMCGLGGVLAEVLDDAVFGVAPLSRAEALDMIGRLKAQKLLNGFRGAAPVDREMLAQILMYVGDLGCICPQIKEIDINPLIVDKGKPVAADALVVLNG
ncbi:MAG: CoA-binding protein [Desulfobacteraceae bacterium IS3]|nr:MAG: CoA-binding protein [Desulfobacteraceae bacterium IS3]